MLTTSPLTRKVTQRLADSLILLKVSPLMARPRKSSFLSRVSLLLTAYATFAMLQWDHSCTCWRMLRLNKEAILVLLLFLVPVLTQALTLRLAPNQRLALNLHLDLTLAPTLAPNPHLALTLAPNQPLAPTLALNPHLVLALTRLPETAEISCPVLAPTLDLNQAPTLALTLALIPSLDLALNLILNLVLLPQKKVLTLVLALVLTLVLTLSLALVLLRRKTILDLGRTQWYSRKLLGGRDLS
jgi:hypothetical protein